MDTLTVLQNKKIFEIPFTQGETILRTLQKNGFSLHAPCGGHGSCNGCTVYVDDILKKACQTPAESGITVTFPPNTLHTDIEILSASDTCAGDHCNALPLGIALDIGTTTIALAVVDLSAHNGHTVLTSHGFWNPTAVYGSDVLSRIEASNSGHADKMQRLLLDAIGKEITNLFAAHDFAASQVQKICIAANTTMCHLFLGLSCQTLGVSPFRPTMLSYPVEKATTLFGSSSSFSDEAGAPEVFLIPGLSAFIGGDITAGLFSVFGPQREDAKVSFSPLQSSPTLFVDMGTNGEMVLLTKKANFAASVAAGPAFEGSRIPGSEVLAALDEMRKKHALDATGLLQGLFFHTGYQYGQHLFTQEDIRAVQIAKASVRAGIETLLDTANVSPKEIAQVCLCGGFGTHTDTAQAISIGMFPAAFSEKIRPMGNTALSGAVRCLTAPSSRYFQTLKEQTRLVELASSKFYKEAYIRWMGF